VGLLADPAGSIGTESFRPDFSPRCWCQDDGSWDGTSCSIRWNTIGKESRC